MGVNATSFFTDHNRFYFINQEQHDALDFVWQMILPCLGFSGSPQLEFRKYISNLDDSIGFRGVSLPTTESRVGSPAVSSSSGGGVLGSR